MKYLTFDDTTATFRVAVLLKEAAFTHDGVLQHYVKPLVDRGLAFSDILALSLPYGPGDKAPVTLIKTALNDIGRILFKHGITHILCADAAYFKVLAKVRKAEPHYGYVLPSIFPGIQVSLTLNYRQLFYNPTLSSRLILGIDALTKDILGEIGFFRADLLKDFSFPRTLPDIKAALNTLFLAPALTCDIETLGLELHRGQIQTISFASSVQHGAAFPVLREFEPTQINPILRKFFECYTGKLIFHNATFDTKMLIRQLYIEDQVYPSYERCLVEGLHVLHRNIDDTKILAYLATNSAAGNTLGLKELAFELTGNYALNDIKDTSKLPLDTLLRYNAVDTVATWHVYSLYREVVRAEQEALYTDLFVPTLKVLTQTELTGLPFDPAQVAKAKHMLKQLVDIERDSVGSHPLIEEFNKIRRVEAMIGANNKLKVKRKTEEDFAGLTFNINSYKQLQQLLYEHLGLPILDYTDKGQPATSNKAIDGLIALLKKQHDL